MGPELERLLPALDEKGRRLVLGAVARAAGDGGVGAVARLTGASWQTVSDGAEELASGEIAPAGRARRPGGGRRPLAESDPGLVPALLALVEDSTRGDPQSPLRWTTLSVEHLAAGLAAAGHPCGKSTVHRMLGGLGYSMQANAKVREGRAQHADRDAQFRHIAALARGHMDDGQPVISVDAKKKEQVGDYAQPGREWRPAGDPVQARDHSFPDPETGHAIPYGIYDVAANTGFINIGTGANTASLAVESLRRWRGTTGKAAYPGATRLLVTCDAGGGNSWRSRAWKKGLAQLAQESGLDITVAHFPPGTSKWNKIEHRLFSQVTHAWRGRPLTSYEVIISTIGAITTSGGLTVTATLDRDPHPKGQEVTDEEMRDIEERCLTRDPFHGEWNYTLLATPRPPREPQAAPEQPPPPGPGWPRDALDQRALTGLDPAGVAALTTALTIPWAADREQHLWNGRGGPRRATGCKTPAHPLHDIVLAALILTRLGTRQHDPGTAFSMSDHQVGRHVLRAARLISQVPHPPPDPPPPEAPLRTYPQLHAYALSHAITGIPPLPPQPTRPQKPR
jgi:Rhodopirellula transposase DDE domain